MSKKPVLTEEQRDEVKRICHEVIQMHIDHDAPDGHKGFEKLEPLLQGKKQPGLLER